MTAPQTCLAPRAPETKRAARWRAPVTLAVGGVLAGGLVAGSAWGGLATTVPASGVESLLIITETGSIDVSVDAVTGVLSTGTGSIGVSGHLIALNAETGTGSVDVRSEDAQTVTASTSTGSLTVHLPLVVKASTGTGSIALRQS